MKGQLKHNRAAIGPQCELILCDENGMKGVLQNIGFYGEEGSNELVLRIIIDGVQQYNDDVDLITLVKDYGVNPDYLLGKGLYLIPLYYNPTFKMISAQIYCNLPFNNSLKISFYNKSDRYSRTAGGFVNYILEV